MPRAALLGVLTVVLVLGGVLALLWARQEQLMFFPTRGISSTPADVGLAFEDVRLTTSDGVLLSAWWVPAVSPRGAVVFCHGNAGSMEHRLERLLYLHGLGLDVLFFDYRGYGTSAGAPSEAGTFRDMDAAVDHVRRVRGVSRERTVFWGESLGGAVAVEAATRHGCGLLVLESTFTSVRAMVRRHYPFVPAALATRLRYDSLARIASVGCPVLVLHSGSDSLTPFAQGEALHAAAAAPKWLSRLEGDHNDGGILVSPQAQQLVREVLDAVLSAP